MRKPALELIFCIVPNYFHSKWMVYSILNEKCVSKNASVWMQKTGDHARSKCLLWIAWQLIFKFELTLIFHVGQSQKVKWPSSRGCFLFSGISMLLSTQTNIKNAHMSLLSKREKNDKKKIFVASIYVLVFKHSGNCWSTFCN